MRLLIALAISFFSYTNYVKAQIGEAVVEQVLNIGVDNIDQVVGVYIVQSSYFGGVKDTLFLYIFKSGNDSFMYGTNNSFEQTDYLEEGLVIKKDGKYKNEKYGLSFLFQDNVLKSISDQRMHYEYVVIQKIYPRNPMLGPKTQGTGFFISKNGWIVTNKHVIKQPTKIHVFVKINGKFKEFIATTIVWKNELDLALIKIDFQTNNCPSIKPNAELVGSKVFALGYPDTKVMGRNLKITDGIINSSTGIGDNENFYQFSAPVQPGNSGGPLINSKGEVIGVVTAKYTDGEIVSYAMKTKLILKLIDFYHTDNGITSLDAKRIIINYLNKNVPTKNATTLYNDFIGGVVLILVD